MNNFTPEESARFDQYMADAEKAQADLDEVSEPTTRLPSPARRQPQKEPAGRGKLALVGIGGLLLGLLLGNLGGSDPEPAASPVPTVTVASGQRQPPVTMTVTAPAPKAATPVTGASSCVVAREAILTGSKADVEKALRALVKDKGADQVAREAAQDYFENDDADIKAMQVDLVQLACSTEE